MKKHRLMIITHDLEIGGLQQVVVNICRTLNRELFDVKILCLRRIGVFHEQVKKLGIEVIQVPKTRRIDYFAFLKIIKILKRHRIEIIHTHNTQPLIDGTMAAILSGVKTIVHTDHARKFPDKLRYMILEKIMSIFAYKIVGVSEHTSNNLIKYERISPAKIMTIPNGIDEVVFNINIDKSEFRCELGIPPQGPIIGFGGRLSEQKGLTYLLQAMPKIIKKLPNTNLIIAGEGPDENELKEEAKKLNIDKNVFFIGPRMDMNKILKFIDIFILPSIWEGLPMIILEAMAAGCPIIATAVGGNATAIHNGVNGRLIPAKDPGTLSTEIIKLLSDSKLRKKYSENSLKIFEKKFSAKIMTRKYERIYLRQI